MIGLACVRGSLSALPKLELGTNPFENFGLGTSGLIPAAMLEYLHLAIALPEWLCALWVTPFLLEFHGERAVVRDDQPHCYQSAVTTQNLHRKVRPAATRKYFQLLPRRQGTSYAINPRHQVVRIKGTQVLLLPELPPAVRLGQSKDALFVLRGDNTLLCMRREGNCWSIQYMVACVVDFTVSWQGQLFVQLQNGKRLLRRGDRDEWRTIDRPLINLSQCTALDFNSLYPSIMIDHNLLAASANETRHANRGRGRYVVRR
jgi:DNA polymerase family B